MNGMDVNGKCIEVHKPYIHPYIQSYNQYPEVHADAPSRSGAVRGFVTKARFYTARPRVSWWLGIIATPSLLLSSFHSPEDSTSTFASNP